MNLHLGPAFLRFETSGNWSHLELGIATRASGGLARRETALKIGIRSDHAIELSSLVEYWARARTLLRHQTR